MRTRGPWLVSLLAVLVAASAMAPEALAQGCAMCGSAFSGDDPLGRAFSLSILFLMAAPYAIAAVAGSWIFYMYRRASGRRRAPVIDLVDLVGSDRLLHGGRPGRNPQGEAS